MVRLGVLGSGIITECHFLHWKNWKMLRLPL